MKRILIFVVVFLMMLSARAEVKIISTEAWQPNITGAWQPDAGLSYSNTVYGDTYYNPNWQDMSKSNNIEHKSVTRWFNLKPNNKRRWSFYMSLTNLNAERGYSYWATSQPNRKQNAEQIYWGIRIGYKENGISRTSQVWLKRSNKKYDSYGYEAYGSAQNISYSIDNNGWKESFNYYPSCSQSSAPVFSIETYPHGSTFIKWGNMDITNFPVYMEELSYITIMIGTQAKVQIGKPEAYGSGVNTNNIYDASEYIQQENYVMAKEKLYRSDQTYYERPAINLALSYAMLNELDKALELTNALIKYKGEFIQYVYALRGLIKEEQGKKLEALDDFQKAGDAENYNRLYNDIFKPQPSQQSQPKPKPQNKSTKPALTK